MSDAISACLIDPRYVVPEQREMLAQRLLTIAASHEDLSDHDTLRDDPVLQTATGKLPDVEEPPAPPSTLCRLEQRVDRRALVEMSKLFVETFLKSFDKPPEQIILDVDATDDSIHGQQKGRFYHGCYRHYCFLPLDVCGRGHLLCALLRASNIDPDKRSRAIIKLLVARNHRLMPLREKGAVHHHPTESPKPHN